MNKRKLWYLMPLALIALNAAPFSLIKDMVNFSTTSTTALGLEPSHWQLREYAVAANLTVTTSTDSQQQTSQPKLSDKATYRGFPAGFYFSHSESTSNGTGTASYSVSAWSWLWLTVDLLLVAILLLLAQMLSRKKTVEIVVPAVPSQPTTPSAIAYNPQVIQPSEIPQQSTAPTNIAPPSAPSNEVAVPSEN